MGEQIVDQVVHTGGGAADPHQAVGGGGAVTVPVDVSGHELDPPVDRGERGKQIMGDHGFLLRSTSPRSLFQQGCARNSAFLRLSLFSSANSWVVFPGQGAGVDLDPVHPTAHRLRVFDAQLDRDAFITDHSLG
ncbi:hypothetical protein [Spirillospora albida]|uniref:hypothetical protein n=1 Tax=Spirillospora albida TaxID=58123 RepID=UPI001FDEFD8A|nr:hypothetical protein [Spirillospora albida]